MAEIALPARCTLCNRKFYGPRLKLVGQPGNRQAHFLEELATHIMQDHADTATMIALGAQEYQGLFILSQYEIDDRTWRGSLISRAGTFTRKHWPRASRTK